MGTDCTEEVRATWIGLEKRCNHYVTSVGQRKILSPERNGTYDVSLTGRKALFTNLPTLEKTDDDNNSKALFN